MAREQNSFEKAGLKPQINRNKQCGDKAVAMLAIAVLAARFTIRAHRRRHP